MPTNLIVEIKHRVMRLTINRPELKNALDRSLYGALADALEASESDPQIRAVLLTATGDIFTAGNDLADFVNPIEETGTPNVIRFLKAISECETPIIVAVNGPAIGIGLTMLLHCDMVYASKSASFRAPFTHVGVVPEAASSLLLPIAVGNAWANDIMIAGRTLNAEEALNSGLISRVFEDENLLVESLKVAEQVAGLAPNSVKQSKHLIRGINKEQIKSQMKQEGEVFAAQLASAEFKESVAAFYEKRAPKFD
ncbi:enoyl-CoA hydratase-related protein [Paraglaciecola arctica]|uniref:enoyl-CoA hydratase-related protein n=1 Tax=Paraglaciecola arctica TaxID=1128911 RepID=UPI001C064BAE|nr:enoyl-CoA hydratase-related protein [Paraglaciecola arctica]MBU3004475.1 enoyl-CoA hydratase/isomerase family protein [Paraglaciecola arctica]